jgi:hypothetical protein
VGPDNGSYETVLVRGDHHNRRYLLILTSVTAPALTLYYERWTVFLTFLPLFLFMVGAEVWRGLRMIRTGHVSRGQARLRGAWVFPAWVVAFGLFILIQSYFGLWFAQHPLPGRYR